MRPPLAYCLTTALVAVCDHHYYLLRILLRSSPLREPLQNWSRHDLIAIWVWIRFGCSVKKGPSRCVGGLTELVLQIPLLRTSTSFPLSLFSSLVTSFSPCIYSHLIVFTSLFFFFFLSSSLPLILLLSSFHSLTSSPLSLKRARKRRSAGVSSAVLATMTLIIPAHVRSHPVCPAWFPP